ALAVRKDEGGAVQRARKPSEDSAHPRSKRDVSSLAILRARDGQHAGSQVDVLPAESEKLALAEPGVQENRDPLAIRVIRHSRSQPCLLLVGEIPDSPARLS